MTPFNSVDIQYRDGVHLNYFFKKIQITDEHLLIFFTDGEPSQKIPLSDIEEMLVCFADKGGK